MRDDGSVIFDAGSKTLDPVIISLLPQDILVVSVTNSMTRDPATIILSPQAGVNLMLALNEAFQEIAGRLSGA